MKKIRFVNLKKVVAAAVTAVLLFCCVDFSAAAASYFSGNITADEAGISVEGISIDIYGSKLKYSANGLKRYEHYYSSTVTTDSNGGFSFVRPSGKTLLKINLSTLPEGTGVNEMTRLVSSQYDDTFTLSYVDDIDIVGTKDGNQYKVNLTSSDGSLVFADYTAKETVSANFYDITYEKINSLKLYRTVTAKAAGIKKTRKIPIDISDCTVTGKLAVLLEYGIIDKKTSDEITEIFNSDTALAEDPRPTFYNERTFTAGNFMMHSEQGTADIEQYEAALAHIVDVFFNQYDFAEPYHEILNGSTVERDKYFNVYLVDPNAIKVESEVSPQNVVGMSVKIDPKDLSKGSYIVLSPTNIESFTKTLAHEIFHCIIYRYTGKNPPGWFKESFANYGALLCLNGSSKSLNKQMGYYLKSTEYPLSNTTAYKYRHYGMTLIPLYIHNKLGGVQTIKNILSAYASSTNAYNAIDKGMKATKSSYSFATLFAGFKDRNAFTEFYKIPDTSEKNESIGIGQNAERTSTVLFDERDADTIPKMTLPCNSAAYFEFDAPEDARGKLYVMVETSEGTSDASYNMILKGKKIIIPSRKNTSGLTTFVVSDFGGKIDTAVLTAGNTSMSANNNISFFASAYFEER